MSEQGGVSDQGIAYMLQQDEADGLYYHQEWEGMIPIISGTMHALCLPAFFFIYNSHLLCLSEYQMCSCKPRCSQYMIPDN